MRLHTCKDGSRAAEKRQVEFGVYCSGFRKPITDLDENERTCLDLILRNYSKHPEVYLTPFLRGLSDVLPASQTGNARRCSATLSSKAY